MSISLPAAKSVNLTVIRINEDNLLTSVVVGSTLLAALFTLAGFILFSRPTGLGIAAGSAIAIVNFIWQRTIMQRVIGQQLSRPALYATFRYLLRLFITALLLYYILTSGLFSLTGLLIGLSVVVVMILFCTVYFAIQHKGD